MKYVPEDQTVRFVMTAQDANGAATFTADATNFCFCMKQSDGSVVKSAPTGSWASISATDADLTGGYTVAIDTSDADFTADQQYDVAVKGTIGSNTYTAKIGEFTNTSLADINQIEKLDQRAWHGKCTSTTLQTGQFSCVIYDGDDNELTLDASATLTVTEQLRNRVVSFNGDQTPQLKGQTAQIASFADGTDEITITLNTGEELSTAPVVNDTFLVSVY